MSHFIHAAWVRLWLHEISTGSFWAVTFHTRAAFGLHNSQNVDFGVKYVVSIKIMACNADFTIGFSSDIYIVFS